jgi:hypothetical protein
MFCSLVLFFVWFPYSKVTEVVNPSAVVAILGIIVLGEGIIVIGIRFRRTLANAGKCSHPIFKQESMEMRITAFPVELYFVIRDSLICYLPEDVDRSDPIENYLRQENIRSWRNFLGMRSDSDWEYIRKKAMIWSLNRCESEKYFNCPLFQRSLHKNVSNSEQLRCCSILHRSYTVRQLNTGMIGYLCIEWYKGKKLPSCSSLCGLNKVLQQPAEARGL